MSRLADNNLDPARNVRGILPALRAHRDEAIFWASSSMRDVEVDVASAIRCNLNVMITGEEGVGKTSIARRIHLRRRRRAAGRFVIAQSPGALDSIESLTRALKDAMPDGMVHVEGAERMSAEVQSRLLEFIERQAVAREPGTTVRFVTVNNANLYELARRGEFSESLFYRLNAIHLIIPPLREHPQDIPVLLRHFMSLPAPASSPCLSRAAWQQLVTYGWPGNVRELQGVADTLAARGSDRLLDVDDLPPALRPSGDS
jgi:DNA-binding NtrC family response regulator